VESLERRVLFNLSLKWYGLPPDVGSVNSETAVARTYRTPCIHEWSDTALGFFKTCLRDTHWALWGDGGSSVLANGNCHIAANVSGLSSSPPKLQEILIFFTFGGTSTGICGRPT